MLYQEKKATFTITIVKIALIISGIIAGFAISRIVIVPFRMPDNSMEPNVHKGDTLIILKHLSPEPGDIVIFDSPAEPGRVLIKRVISTEGDAVEIRDKAVYINNKKFDFRWKTRSVDKRIFPMIFTHRDAMPALKTGRNQYFVLSDNLDQGFDSRTLGLIRKASIIGRSEEH